MHIPRGLWSLCVVALTSAFWLSGITKLADFDGAVQEVRGLAGVEPAPWFAALVIVTQLAAPLILLLGGRWRWVGAVWLAGFTAVATLVAHAWWLNEGPARARDFATFFEHVGLIAGLALAALTAPRAEKTPAA
jgi:transmembrane protein